MTVNEKRIPDEVRFERKKINDFIDKAIGEDLNDFEIKEKLEELETIGEEVLFVLLSRLGDTNYQNQNFVVHALKLLDLPGKVEALKNLIEDDTRSDQEKVSAANLLQGMGHPQDFEYISAQLHNPHQMFMNALESMIESLDKESAIIQTFKTVLLMPDQGRHNLIENLKQFSDLRINRLFIPLMIYSSKDIQLNLLEHFKDYWSEDMLLPLRYLSETSENEEVSKIAHMAFFKTEMKVKNIPKDTTFNNDLPPIHRCVVSNIDGDGGQIVSISRKKKSGKLTLFNVFFNDNEGIKDCLGIDSLLEKQYDEMFGKMLLSGVIFNQVSLDFAKECIIRGFETSIKNNKTIPENFFVWYRHLYEDNALTKKEEEFNQLDKVNLAQNEDYFYESYSLLDLDEFESWFVEVPENRKQFYISQVNKARKKRGEARKEKIEVIISQAIEEFVTNEIVERIGQRLLRQAPLLFIFHGKEACAWALAAAQPLTTDSSFSLSEHPLIREMMIIGLSHFVEGI